MMMGVETETRKADYGVSPFLKCTQGRLKSTDRHVRRTHMYELSWLHTNLPLSSSAVCACLMGVACGGSFGLFLVFSIHTR